MHAAIRAADGCGMQRVRAGTPICFGMTFRRAVRAAIFRKGISKQFAQ
jgi:hypothetical protein